MKITYSVLFERLFPFCFINSANFSINLGNDIHCAFFFFFNYSPDKHFLMEKVYRLAVFSVKLRQSL